MARPKQGSSSAHGSPLGADEVTLTKENLGWEGEDPFYVPEEAQAYFRKALERGVESRIGLEGAIRGVSK